MLDSQIFHDFKPYEPRDSDMICYECAREVDSFCLYCTEDTCERCCHIVQLSEQEERLDREFEEYYAATGRYA